MGKGSEEWWGQIAQGVHLLWVFAHLQNCLNLGTEKYFQVISVSDASDFKNHKVPTRCILVEITAHWQLEYFFFF